MQFLLLIYNDETLLEAMQDGEFDRTMKQCIVHADELRADGFPLQSPTFRAETLRFAGFPRQSRPSGP